VAKQVKIKINKDGTVEMDAVGFKGKGCEEVVKALSKSLGKIEKDGHKPDWSMPEPSKATVVAKKNEG